MPGCPKGEILGVGALLSRAEAAGGSCGAAEAPARRLCGLWRPWLCSACPAASRLRAPPRLAVSPRDRHSQLLSMPTAPRGCPIPPIPPPLAPQSWGGSDFCGTPPPARSSPHITPTCAHRAARCPPGPAGFKLSRCWALSPGLGTNYCFVPGGVIAPLPPFTSRFAPQGHGSGLPGAGLAAGINSSGDEGW